MEPINVSSLILIADDDQAIASLTRQILESQGYQVLVAGNGLEAMDILSKQMPDLILLDVRMPKMDGYEVCSKVKEDLQLRHLPILMLTVDGDSRARVKGLDLGADDYIVKPFDPQELLARVKTSIRRVKLDLDANPLTHLPGNNTIDRVILTYIQQSRPYALMYADLNYFKAYNDCYGFAKGDQVIRLTARALCSVVQGDTGFVCHVGGDDFIAFTRPEIVEQMCQKVIVNFENMVPEFYSEEDRARGFYTAVNRQGDVQQFPFIGLAIGVIIDNGSQFQSLGEISKISAEVKKCAKQNKRSAYFIDRRASSSPRI